MRYFVTEDIFYYHIAREAKEAKKDSSFEYEKKYPEKYDKYQTLFSSFDTIYIMPSTEKIQTFLGKSNICILTTEQPNPKYGALFQVEELENLYDILTSQEFHAEVSEELSMERKFGLKTSKPTLNFNDLRGAFIFKEWASRLQKVKEKGYALKPVMMIGVPGVGKTYGAVCYAGEMNLPLMQLDLSLISEKSNPVTTINKLFSYLEHMNQEVVLLIDEIEQMLTAGNEAIIGALLTIFNDLNTKEGYQFKGILFATSNNISELTQKYPQFIRHGRWNEKFFVNFPTKVEALDVMDDYRKKYNLDDAYFTKSRIELIYISINKTYKDSNIKEKRSVYSNSEISYFFQRLSLYYDESMSENEKNAIIKEQIKAVEPLQKTTHAAIQKLIKDAELNKFQEI